MLTSNAAEVWALAEAFLWLRDESGDNKSIPVTLVYDSEVAKALMTELPRTPLWLAYLGICMLGRRILVIDLDSCYDPW